MSESAGIRRRWTAGMGDGGRRLGLGLLVSATVAACGNGGSATGAAGAPVPVAPDYVIRNADVRTMEADAPRAEAIAVKDGKIVYVGSNAGLSAYPPTDATEVIDAAGRLVVPGFSDTHNHVSDHPENFFWVNTRQMTIPEIGRALRKYREENPGVGQIRAIGWDEKEFARVGAESGKTPAQLIDAYVPDLPVLILDHGHHDMVANSMAFRNAGIDGNTPNPPGAIIERVAGTPGHGRPSGIVREFGALSMLENALPVPDFTVDQFKFAVLDWQKLAAAAGVTSVLVPQPRPSANFYEAMKQLDDEGKLTVRYSVAIWANEHRGVEQVPEMVALRAKYPGGKRYRIDTIKFFTNGYSLVDGAWKPFLVWDQDTLNATAAAVAGEGFRIFMHNTGNLSQYNAALDAIEHARKVHGRSGVRHAMTHVDHNDVGDAELPGLARRFKALDVIADGHPPGKAFFDAGVQATSSSDYPAIHNPFRPTALIGQGAKDGIPVETMLASLTLHGARLMSVESETGSIKVGKSADIVMLDQNVFDIAPGLIEGARPVLTFSQGQPVYEAP